MDTNPDLSPTGGGSAERMRRKRARDRDAQPRLRVVDGTGDDVPLAAQDELVLLTTRLASVVEAVTTAVTEADPERAGARVAEAEARAAAAEARAAEARADLRDAVAAAEEAEERAQAAHDAATAAGARAEAAEEQLVALRAEHDQTVAALAAAESALRTVTENEKRLAGELVDLEDVLLAERARADVAEVARMDAVSQLDRLVDAFSKAAESARPDRR